LPSSFFSGASYAIVKINGFNWRWQKMGPEFHCSGLGLRLDDYWVIDADPPISAFRKLEAIPRAIETFRQEQVRGTQSSCEWRQDVDMGGRY